LYADVKTPPVSADHDAPAVRLDSIVTVAGPNVPPMVSHARGPLSVKTPEDALAVASMKRVVIWLIV
jgi:hypothetical protein